MMCLQEVRTPTTPVKKDGNQWYDVGIIKGTSCLVSYYHLPSENAGNGDVEKRVSWSIIHGPWRDKTGLRGFMTKGDSNQPAQLQRLARKLKFRS